jgi:hypothetical protein
LTISSADNNCLDQQRLQSWMSAMGRTAVRNLVLPEDRERPDADVASADLTAAKPSLDKGVTHDQLHSCAYATRRDSRG